MVRNAELVMRDLGKQSFHPTTPGEEGQLYFYHSFYLMLGLIGLIGPSGRPRCVTPGFLGLWSRKVNPSLVDYSPLIAGLMRAGATLCLLVVWAEYYTAASARLSPSFTLPVPNSSRNISLKGFTSNVMRPLPAATGRVPSATISIDWQIRALERMICCLMECCQDDVCRGESARATARVGCDMP